MKDKRVDRQDREWICNNAICSENGMGNAMKPRKTTQNTDNNLDSIHKKYSSYLTSTLDFCLTGFLGCFAQSRRIDLLFSTTKQKTKFVIISTVIAPANSYPSGAADTFKFSTCLLTSSILACCFFN
jgi:hypothetical protein